MPSGTRRAVVLAVVPVAVALPVIARLALPPDALPVTTRHLTGAYLTTAAALTIALVAPYWRLYHRITTATRSLQDASDGDPIAVTGELDTQGTIRSPVTQSPAALAAWQTHINTDDAGFVSGVGYHTTISRLRHRHTPVTVDVPSAAIHPDDDSNTGGVGLRTALAIWLRRTPGLLVDDLLVLHPDANNDDDEDGDDGGEDVVEHVSYPAGEPPTAVRAYVGEHRDHPGGSPLERVFGVTPGRQPDGGTDATETHDDDGETVAVTALRLPKRSVATVLATYRTDGGTGGRLTGTDGRLDILTTGRDDALREWARDGLLYAAYPTACLAIAGALAFLIG
jgi:hypothetical protein